MLVSRNVFHVVSALQSIVFVPTDDSFQAFCDMDTERGGWTLVATKVSPDFIFIKPAFSTSAAKTTLADAASHIHPGMGDWEEVMFRFGDIDTIRVIYSREAGAPQNEKTDFEKFLMGGSAALSKNVYGFYKYSQAGHNKRSPGVGFAKISRLHFYSTDGISEDHGGTDKWKGVDGSRLLPRTATRLVPSLSQATAI